MTQQQASCSDTVYELSTVGLDEIPFMQGLLDAFVRSGFLASIANVPACDAQQALYNMTCALQPQTQIDVDRNKLQALLAYAVNQYGCTH